MRKSIKMTDYAFMKLPGYRGEVDEETLNKHSKMVQEKILHLIRKMIETHRDREVLF